MTSLVYESDLVGRYNLAGTVAALRVRPATTRPIAAVGGSAKLVGSAARLRQRRPYTRTAYALTGRPADLVIR